jgi:flagella synthesis protein FlgN
LPAHASNTTSLPQVLAAEAACVEDFIAVLKLEQNSLAQGAGDELPAYAEQKAQLAQRLGALAAQRNAALKAQDLAADRPGLDAWCAAHPKEIQAASDWSRIIALATEARELNRVNGELIALRMQYNAQALEALRGGSSALDLYGPDGQATGSGGRRISDSV